MIMKELNEYLSAKVKLEDNTVFPEEPNLKKTVLFLKNKGFRELEFDDKMFYVTILEENKDSKRFMSNSYHSDGSDLDWIRFIDKGSLCKENPAFCIYFKDGKPDLMYEEFSLPSGKGNRYTDYKDFVKAANDKFKWK